MKKRLNRKGVALLMSIFFLSLLSFIAMEVAFDSSVYYSHSSQKINVLKARYLAKAGLKISLIRIWVFNQLKMNLKQMSSLGMNRILDEIWQSPFAWPPDDFLKALGGKIFSNLEKDLKQSKKETLMDGSYIVSIQPLSQKLNLNLLRSNDQKVQKASFDLFKKIILKKIEFDENLDEDLKESFDDQKVTELLENIQDWVDLDNQRANEQGEESSIYNQFPISLPFNLALKTPKEILMIKDLAFEFLDLIKDYFSIYGGAKISVNYLNSDFLSLFLQDTSKEDLQSIFYPDPEKTQNMNKKFYKNEKEFFASLDDLGLDEEDKNQIRVFLSYDAPSNFLVSSLGQSRKNTLETKVYLFDSELFKAQHQEIKKQIENLPSSSSQNKKKSDSVSSAKKPKIVYWEEN